MTDSDWAIVAMVFWATIWLNAYLLALLLGNFSDDELADRWSGGGW